ncbi:hypothetical protein PR048_004528 [Dryococelus australis]|uniref:Uncharacterized protein n=1 Tax=Dryococelus australis TaxID=614101 RepID=A0ABQ9I5N6_9NEOP|nr:hypothetical protein PR048_004528 [Dryococelus australis]
MTFVHLWKSSVAFSFPHLSNMSILVCLTLLEILPPLVKLAAWFDNHPLFPIMSGIIRQWGNRRYPIFGYYAVMKRSVDNDLRMYLEYELAPFPLALFNESRMRKIKKSGMYTLFHITKNVWNPSNFDIVVYGGFLMHKVIWPRGCTVSTICEGYIKSYYPGRSCCVVFDGYPNSSNSTNTAEREQWCRMTNKTSFSNEHNKSRLIILLKSQLNENGIESRQAPGDADLLIVTTAIDKSKPLDKPQLLSLEEMLIWQFS